MVAGKNRFAPELNEKEVIEPLEDFGLISWGRLQLLFHLRLLDTR